MSKVYIGLDVHKAQMQIGLAFSGRRDVEFYGKSSTDVDSFLAVLRRILKKYDLAKTEVRFAMRPVQQGSCWRVASGPWGMNARSWPPP